LICKVQYVYYQQSANAILISVVRYGTSQTLDERTENRFLTAVHCLFTV